MPCCTCMYVTLNPSLVPMTGMDGETSQQTDSRVNESPLLVSEAPEIPWESTHHQCCLLEAS